MSTYKQIAGTTVKAYTTNPSDPQEGEMWYNQTTLKLRGVTAVGAWSSGGLLTTGRLLGGAFGTQTAAVYSVGQNPPPFSSSNATEEYNGVGWSNGTNYPTSLGGTGGTAGTQTNGLFAGGPPGLTASNLYDGSTWTSTGALNRGGDNIGNCGTGTTSDVIFCIGRTPATGNSGNNQSETFDGSTFSTAPNYNTSRMLGVGMGSGTATAGLIFGGFTDPSPGPAGLTACEEYNGTSWTTVNGLNRSDGLSSGWGTQTNTVKATGQPSYILAEQYDGSTWTNISDMSTGGPYANSAGSTGNAGMVTGLSPTRAQTEEYNFSAQVVTPGAWSSGTALPGIRWNTSGAGTQTAGLVFGGSTGPATTAFLNTTFEYDGSSWTSSGTTPKSSINQFSAGIQTAAIGGGGLDSTASNTTTAYTYDGSTWTTITATPFATKGAGGAGTTTAALIYGSDISPSDNQDSYSWNGSSWSEEGALNNTFQNGASGGPTETTAFAAGSEYSPAPSTRFETYDGSSWTSGPSLNTAAYQNRGFGSSAECLSIGGYNKITTVERFDGTAWATSPTLGTGRKQFAAANFTAPGVSNGWVGGGADGDSSVEHFTEETTSVNSVDITTAE